MQIQVPQKRVPVPYRVERFYIDGRGFEIYERIRISLTDDGLIGSIIGEVEPPLPEGIEPLSRYFSVGVRLCDFGGGPIPHQFSFDIPESTLAAAIEKWEHYSHVGWQHEEKRIHAEIAKNRLIRR